MIPIEFDKLEKGIEYYCKYEKKKYEFGEPEPITILGTGEKSFIRIIKKEYKKKYYKKFYFIEYDIIRYPNGVMKLANFSYKDYIEDHLCFSFFRKNEIKIYLPEAEIIRNRSILRQYIQFFNEKTKTNIGDNIKNIIGEFLFKDYDYSK